MNFSFDWSDAINPARRDFVYENRNKKYGGYALRKDYNGRLLRALIITLSGICFLFIIPTIISYLSKSPIKKAGSITEGIVFDKPPVYATTPQPLAAQHPPVQHTTKFTPLKAVRDDEADDNSTIPEKGNEGQAGTKTIEGNSSLVDIPQEGGDTLDEAPKMLVDEMPVFPGGNEKLFGYLSNIKYPAIARENGIQGCVYLTFVIDKNGKIKDIKKLRGIGGGCDEEAIRVVSKMPDWKPGRQDGRNVAVQFNLPVNFRLQ